VKQIYQQLIQLFLQMIQKIKSLNPAYKQPGDGSNGVCDCIGLIIGAIRRMGLRWNGIHGSNYAARFMTDGLAYISSLSELELGDCVYKAVHHGGRGQKPCNGGTFVHEWKLPDRYQKGSLYTPDNQLDFYHVGVVTSVNPLRITHMTSPHMKVDTSIGNWNYHGKIKPIVEAAEKGSVPVPEPAPTPTSPVPSAGVKAIVEAENGKPVKMREYPSTKCATWENVPCGTEVTVLEPGEEWCRIEHRNRKWYMMAKFVDIIGDGKGKH